MAAHSINHAGARLRGWFTAECVLAYDGGDKECYFRPRNSSEGEVTRHGGLPTWKPHESNLAKAFRLPVTSIERHRMGNWLIPDNTRAGDVSASTVSHPSCSL